MPNKVKGSLEAIIKVSRQLLSQLNSQIENYESTDGVDKINNKLISPANDSVSTEQSQLTDEQLSHLATERQSLITTLFEVNTQDKLSSQLPLINEMVLLDEQLTSKSQSHKNNLAEHVLKLKKSKKVSTLYQKY